VADSLTFKTDGVWKADELSRFVTAVNTIYKGFLAVHITRQSTPSIEELVSRAYERWFSYYRRYGRPIESEEEFMFPVISPDMFSTFPAQRSSYLAFVYGNILTIAPDDQLTVGKVRMGSPGEISFLGLGPAIREVKDCIKDWNWRNRHERERSEMEMQQSRERHRLDMLKGYLELQSEYGEILAGPAKELAADVLEGIAEVEQLEIEGKVQVVDTDTEDKEET
jgi:hypothetical protein